MNRIWTFVAAMTFWNWLALIAFAFGCVSVLNAILTLRGRFKDWRGTQNQKWFQSRTRELSDRLHQHEEYKRNPTHFYSGVLYSTFRVAQVLVVIFTFLMWAFYEVAKNNARGKYFVLIPFFLMGWLVSNRITELTSRARDFHMPHLLALRIIDFVENASKKGLQSADADALVIRLHNNAMFNESEKERVANYIAAHVPRLLADIFHNAKRRD